MDYTPIMMPAIKLLIIASSLLLCFRVLGLLLSKLFSLSKGQISRQPVSTKDRQPFSAKASLLTAPELNFARGIIPYLPDHLHLCPKVSLKDVVHHGPNGLKNGNFGRISQKHLDFVIIESETGRIRLAIEIDDRSHQRADRQKSDQVKNQALAEAGIPLLRIAPRQSIAIEEILQAMAA
ncbi:MAG: DUF2726 domain-containing protein [Fimbriimonadaceae bacterium]|nr:MAG: DUF2726 domain-containing protein [Fimbriimonadaceae bacterium]